MKSILVAQDYASLEAFHGRKKPANAVLLQENGQDSVNAGTIQIKELLPASFREQVNHDIEKIMKALAFGNYGFLNWPPVTGPMHFWWLADRVIYKTLDRIITSYYQAKALVEYCGDSTIQISIQDKQEQVRLGSMLQQMGARLSSFSNSTKHSVARFGRIPGARSGEEMLRSLATKVRGVPAPDQRTQKPILLVTYSGYWRPRDSQEPDLASYTDAYIGNLIDQMEAADDFWPVAVSVRRSRGPMTVSGGFRHFKRILSGTLPYIPLEVFFKPYIRERNRESQKWIQERKKELKNLPENMQRQIALGGIDIWKTLRPSIERVLDDVPHYVEHYLLFREMIKHFQPAAVVQYGEMQPLGKTLTWACHSVDVPSVAIQHEVKPAIGFMSTDTKAKTRSSGPDNGRPIPDYTYVFGPLWKKHLIENYGYPSQRIVAAGFHRLDRMFATRTKPKYPGQNVLFLLSYIREKEIQTILESFGKYLKKYPDLKVYLRAHPLDKELDTQFDLKNSPENIQKAPVDVSLNSLLQECDMVVTRNYVATLEAVACGKPVIYPFLSQDDDPFGFVEKGLAKGTLKIDHFNDALYHLLNDSSEIKKRIQTADKAMKQLISGSGNNVTETICAQISKLSH